MAGHHPIGHQGSSLAKLTSDEDWVSYWVSYYMRSRQLRRASVKSWKSARETWKRKLVQAERIRCRECSRIAHLWLRTFGYGPKRYLLQKGIATGPAKAR